MSSAELLPQIFSLTRVEQAKIAQAIRDHLYDQHSPIDLASFNAELLDRAADADAHPEDASSLDEVVDRVKKNLQQGNR